MTAAQRPARGDLGVGADAEHCGEHRHDQAERDAGDRQVGVGDVSAGRRHEPDPEQRDQGDRGHQAGQADGLAGRGRVDALGLQRAHIHHGAGR
jgi:hypothetical protein